MARAQVRTKRVPAEPWRRVEVVPADDPREAAESMRGAIHVLADAFRSWLRQREGREGADHGSEPPS